MKRILGVSCLAFAGLVVFSHPAGATEKQGEPMAPRPIPKAEAPKAALKAITVYPSRVRLDGPRDGQRLGVLGQYADGRQWDLTREAQFVSSDPTVAAIEQGRVRAVANGQAVVTVSVGGQSVAVPVEVSNVADVPVSFTREVVPVLTKTGCNQGACHGAQHGRGGFKLSLLGFDPAFDFAQIVQSAEGRRVVVSQPEASILLQKPALVMEHGGGERFRVQSREYELLRRWLEDGAPEPSANDPAVV
ncbi:MAG: Ig-like domain-containing protein, partial [Gemmataceae bacterium]|nr:Ig-like domain-containing protein [Gemmataceae bacterium]MDW8265356.1 hypothetical protein [Gemmataceae bacterium]